MPQKTIKEGLTFDDVLIVPGKSAVLPRQAEVKTRLTRHIKLNIPLVSAAMDTVTEAPMAIVMARLGGIGIIHKNMTIAQQAKEVSLVKRSESGMIQDPITLGPTRPLKDALKLMKIYHIAGLPVVDKRGKLVGIITNRDLLFETNLGKKVSEVMTKNNLVTAPPDITSEKAEKILHQNRIEKLPLVDKKGILKGLITVKDIIKRKQFPEASKDGFGRLRVGAAIGVATDTLERTAALIGAGVDVLVIDTAHGHSQGVIKTIRSLRKKFSKIELIAGNIATPEAALDLIREGVDAVKVGVGPGSICTARIISGVGVPQLSAIMAVAKVTQAKNIPLVADGGIRYSGDITKAIVAGADSVMIGNLLAGTEESPGETILLEGRSFKLYRGMGSVSAMKMGSRDRYSQEGVNEVKKLVPEGIEGRVPYKGPAAESIYQLVGGLRSGMGYVGATDLKTLKKASFVQITKASVAESHPHDIIITQEAPNYPGRGGIL